MIFLTVYKGGILTTSVNRAVFLLASNQRGNFTTDSRELFSRGSLRPKKYFKGCSGVETLRKAGLSFGSHFAYPVGVLRSDATVYLVEAEQ